jgi:hypothetical protein
MPCGLQDTRGHQYPDGGGGCIGIVYRPEIWHLVEEHCRWREATSAAPAALAA